MKSQPMSKEEYWECVSCGAGGYGEKAFDHLKTFPTHAMRLFDGPRGAK